MSGFLFQIDVTFNTNQLNICLFTNIVITNTLKTFSTKYCYTTSELTEAFTLIYLSLQNMVFYACPGFSVIPGDFSVDLSAL